MSGIFDRASFYDEGLYSQAAYPKLSGGQLVIKYALFAINLLFFIFGAVLIAVGSYAANNSLSAITGTTAAYGIVALGVFILLLSLVGAAAAFFELRALLVIYFIVLLLLTIILFAVGIAVYVEKNQAQTLILQGWAYAPDDLKGQLQTTFACCGMIPGYNNGTTTGYINSTAVDPQIYYDKSCFLSNTVTLVRGANVTGLIVPAAARGCIDTFTSYFSSYLLTAGATGFSFAIFMLLGMIVVCCLMSGIKKKQTEQDLAKLRAAHNTEDIDLDVAPIAGTTAGDEGAEDEDEDDEEEEEDDEDER